MKHNFNEIYIRISETQFKRLILSVGDTALLLVNDGDVDKEMSFNIHADRFGLEVNDVHNLDIVSIEDIHIPHVDAIDSKELFKSSVGDYIESSYESLDDYLKENDDLDTSRISIEDSDSLHSKEKDYEVSDNGLYEEKKDVSEDDVFVDESKEKDEESESDEAGVISSSTRGAHDLEISGNNEDDSIDTSDVMRFTDDDFTVKDDDDEF